MKLSKIIDISQGEYLTDFEAHEKEVKGACAADLMSDVLTSAQPHSILLTGLCNPQVIRTALMADLNAILLVRGKQPNQETIELANQERIPVISSPYGMFELCGRLYQAGLSSHENGYSDGFNAKQSG